MLKNLIIVFAASLMCFAVVGCGQEETPATVDRPAVEDGASEEPLAVPHEPR